MRNWFCSSSPTQRIVGVADALGDAVEVVDRREDVLHGDVVGNQLGDSLSEHGFQVVLILGGVENLAEDVEADVLSDAALLLRVEIDVAGDVDHAVRDDLDDLAVEVLDVGDGYARVLDLERLRLGDLLVPERHDLARAGIGDRLREDVALETVGDAELLVIFVSAHAGHIVAVLVKEEVVDMGLGAVDGRRLRRTQLLVDLDQTFLDVVRLILFDGGADSLVVAEEVEDLGVTSYAQRADKRGDGELSVLVDTDIENVVDVGLILQPRAAVRDDGRGKELLACFVVIHFVINAG